MPGVRDTLHKQDRQVYTLTDKFPVILRLLLWKIANDTRKDLKAAMALFTNLVEPDQIVLQDANTIQALGQMVAEPFRQGTRGAALNWKLESRQ